MKAENQTRSGIELPATPHSALSDASLLFSLARYEFLEAKNTRNQFKCSVEWKSLNEYVESEPPCRFDECLTVEEMCEECQARIKANEVVELKSKAASKAWRRFKSLFSQNRRRFKNLLPKEVEVIEVETIRFANGDWAGFHSLTGVSIIGDSKELVIRGVEEAVISNKGARRVLDLMETVAIWKDLAIKLRDRLSFSDSCIDPKMIGVKEANKAVLDKINNFEQNEKK